METIWLRRLSEGWVWLTLTGILLTLLAAILIANSGVFVYTLDDPYIHLQFSTQLARGHFGLVPEELSSPSSSILWPLLLTPFAFSTHHDFVPLVLDVAATFSSLALWRYTLRHFVLCDSDRSGLHADFLALAALLATNAVGLAFSGMEHPLQITATLAALAGAIELIQAGRVRWWLIAGVVAGPLLRYENIPISLAVLAVMLASRAWWWTLICAVGIAIGLGGFALVSLSLGLPPIPGSMQLKAIVGQQSAGLLDQIRSVLGHFAASLLRGRWPTDGLVLILLSLLWMLLPQRDSRFSHWLLLSGVAVSMGLQMIFGGHGNLARYDSAFFNAGLLCCAFFFREALQAVVRRVSGARFGIVAFLLIAVTMPQTAGSLVLTPLAAQDIYRQQWQMRRFLVFLGNEAVAVSDVGLTSYRSTWRVLDLVGLGSDEMRRLRRAGGGSEAGMMALLERRQTELVMTYPSWAPSLKVHQLEAVARFELGRRPVSAAGREVVVLATNPAAAARLRQKASEFSATMPPGSLLEIVPPRNGH